MYLLVYTGSCQSTIVNGVKFTHQVRTANVDDDKAKLFLSSNGNPLYNDIKVVEIKKSDVIPNDDNDDVVDEDFVADVVDEDFVADVVDEDFVADVVDEDPVADVVDEDPVADVVDEDFVADDNELISKDKEIFTVAGLKKDNTLDKLKILCDERKISNEGSKTELAERIIAYEEELESKS